MNKIKAEGYFHLHELMANHHEKYGLKGDLNYIDVSGIKTMNYLFYGSQYYYDISGWDVSNVEEMEGIFDHSLYYVKNMIPYWYHTDKEQRVKLINIKKENEYILSTLELDDRKKRKIKL